MTLTKEWLETQLDFMYEKVLTNLTTFETLVPADVSKDYVYPAVESRDWTDGFWSGILNLANEYRPNQKIEKVINSQLAVFQERLDKEIVLRHHDLGFLYVPSAVAKYKTTHDQNAKQMALQAAEVLMRRYQVQAKIIQAWGDLADVNQQGRMIIDCNMNLSLLYFASTVSGNLAYYKAAYNHVKNAQKYLVREDASTYHTYYMDIKTGQPRYGATAQGYSDTSCWSRGQAWGIYGFPISFNHTGDTTLLDSAIHLADYFIEHLPEDKVPYWDLVFTEGAEERDTSAASIAVCGLLELSRNLPLLHEKRAFYEETAKEIMASLMANYTTKNYPESNGLLTQGVYSKPENNGVDECTTWGDYFYFEALTRLYKTWATFW